MIVLLYLSTIILHCYRPPRAHRLTRARVNVEPQADSHVQVPREHLRPVGEAELSLQAKQAAKPWLLSCFEAMAAAAAGYTDTLWRPHACSEATNLRRKQAAPPADMPPLPNSQQMPSNSLAVLNIVPQAWKLRNGWHFNAFQALRPWDIWCFPCLA